MNIIGFGGSGHDWSSCVITSEGEVVSMEEERMNRLKYGIGGNLLKSMSRSEVLASVSLEKRDIDVAVACEMVPLPFFFPFRKNILRVRHHEAHAFSTFYTSPFEKAAILVVDNAGSIVEGDSMSDNPSVLTETTTFWIGDKSGVRLIKEIVGHQKLDIEKPTDFYAQPGLTNNSLGQLYRLCSEAIGFVHVAENGGVVSEDGKTMGLATYGDMRYYPELRPYLELKNDGGFSIQLSDGRFRNHLTQLTSGYHFNKPSAFMRLASIARAVQVMIEDALIHMATYLRKVSRAKNLALAGGVALNCVANTKIVEKSGFEDIYIVPASGDSGIALGAALYGRIKVCNLPSIEGLYQKLPFLGVRYGEDDVFRALKKFRPHLSKALDCTQPFQKIAELIAEGNIIAWFEGKSEFGPRALGHRSILGDPRYYKTRETINSKIKNREAFRPFAGAFLEESLTEYIDTRDYSALPFMLMVGKLRLNKRKSLQAITHEDGTTRIQSVNSNRYPTFYNLIRAFKELTGEACLLNTSFNLSGEPLVESPEDAISCFLRSKLDYLYLEGRIYTRSTKKRKCKIKL